jgi:hypothetical protein
MNASALELVGQAGLGYSFGSFTGRRDKYSTAIKHLLYVYMSTYFQLAHFGENRPAIIVAGPWLPFMIVFQHFGTARFRSWVADLAPSKAVQGLRRLVRVQHDQANEILSARKALLASGQDLHSATGGGKDVLTLMSEPTF